VDPANGANKELLYTDELCKEFPRLSPDGQWITYYASECGQARPVGLWLLNIKQETAWPVNATVPAWDSDWLPDSKLFYTEYPSFVFDPYGDEPPDFGTDYTTFVYDPATKTRTQVLALPFGVKYAVYEISPTEEKIAAVKRGEEDLFVMNLDGSQARMLIKDYSMQSFAWSPDGKSLAYAQGLHRSEIYVIDVDSGHIRQLTYQDRERGIIVRNWSPDGKWIAFRHSERNNRLCLIRQTGL
jgi:Tol biopolymer transport system component